MNMTNNKNARPTPSIGASRRTKIGTYTFVITLVVLAILIIINLFVAALPKTLTVIDTSATGLYSISDGTKKYIGQIDEEVTLNWICQNGERDAMLEAFLERYIDLNPKVKLNIIDPIAKPAALDKYLPAGTEPPSNFSLIVESGRRFKIVDYLGLFYYYNSFFEQQYGISDPVTYDFYSYYYELYYEAESYGYSTDILFYGDDTITKAVEYTVLEIIPHIYILEGHGESTFTQTFLSFISQNNIEYESLYLAGTGSIPEAANCIVIHSPAADLSNEETAMISEFLKNGGNMILITSPNNVGMSNLMSLVKYYGVSAAPGIVYEGDSDYFVSTPYTLKPDINESHTITTLSSYTMRMPSAHGIIIDDNTNGVTTLFKTSSSAYSVVDGVSSEAGELALGVAISNQTSGGTAQIIWYSSAEAFTDTVAYSVDYGNYYCMLYTFHWADESYVSALSNVTGVPLSEPILDGLSAGALFLWGPVFIIVIPLTVFITGLVIWLRRRKR